MLSFTVDENMGGIISSVCLQRDYWNNNLDMKLECFPLLFETGIKMNARSFKCMTTEHCLLIIAVWAHTEY